MEKKICAYLFVITFILASHALHAQSPNAYRSPSVEPITEVDIQDAKVAQDKDTGYDFAPAPTGKTRLPANIVSKHSTSNSYIGPFIFLIALPIGLWIMVSKKFSKEVEDRKVDYYAKTHQFKPYKTDYQNSAEDDDDIDYPKAS